MARRPEEEAEPGAEPDRREGAPHPREARALHGHDVPQAEVLAAVDETVSAMHKGAGARGGAAGSEAEALADRLWEGLSAQVYVFLHQTRLSDVVQGQLAPCPAVPGLLELVDE